jgi:vacuolar-type H+-ATPase subunit I/STV1
MSLTTQFEQDADALKVQDDQLVGVAAMAKRAKELEKELQDLEETVKERKAQFRKLTEESIPEVLAQLNLRSFKMADGSSIEVKPFLQRIDSRSTPCRSLSMASRAAAWMTSLRTLSASVLDVAKTSFALVY